MIRVGILGSTGYVGAELTRLLIGHPQVKISFFDSRSYHGKKYVEVYPSLRNFVEDRCTSIDIKDHFHEVDVLFCALPHGLSQDAVKSGLAKGKKVIDISADFRLVNQEIYEKWYGVKHKAVEELKRAVYGLTEIYKEKIKKAQLVANPGCYPTSVLLALYPLLKEKAVSTEGIIIDSKSGVSGAGRTPSDGNLFAQCNESTRAYSLCSHRHTPEIEQELSFAAGEKVVIQFTPHLVPMTRGILSTIYLNNSHHLKESDLEEIYRQYYSNERFIRIIKEGNLPQTKAVYGSNYCDIGLKVDERTGKVIVVSAIDNLIKGAAGQALQNMNLMFGLDQSMGLKQIPIWP